MYYAYVLDSSTPVWLMSSVVVCSSLVSYVAGMLLVSFIYIGAAIFTGFGAFVFCIYLIMALPIFNRTIIYPFFIASFIIPGSMVAYMAFNKSMIFSTALIGSFCITRGISIFAGYFPNELSTYNAVMTKSSVDVHSLYPYIFIVTCLGSVVLCIV